MRRFAINPTVLAIAAVMTPLALGLSFYCWYICGQAPAGWYPARSGNVMPNDDLMWVFFASVAVFFVAFFVLVLGFAGKVADTDRRIRLGLCIACGYDMRESPARCPECGRPFQPSDYARHPLTRWQTRIWKIFAVLDHWWMYLAGAIFWGLLAIFDNFAPVRIAFVGFSLYDLYLMVSRIMKGSDFHRALRERARR